MDTEEQLEQLETMLQQWTERTYPYGDDIYADYRDTMSETEAQQILASPYPEDALTEACEQWYEEQASDMEYEAFQAARESLAEQAEDEDAFTAFWDAHEDELMETFREAYAINYPIDHYRDQSFPCDILLESPNDQWEHAMENPYANTFFGDDEQVQNAMQHLQDGTTEQDRDAHAMKASGIARLAQTQGYSYPELLRFFQHATDSGTYEQKGFLPSLAQEIYNANDYPCGVVFLKRFTLGELMELQAAKKQNKDYELLLDRGTACGLYDGSNGAGGPFEITLEEPVRLPLSQTAAIVLDKENDVFSYDIADTYGMSESAWTEGAFLTDEQAKRSPKPAVPEKHAVLYSSEPYLAYAPKTQTVTYLGYLPVTNDEQLVKKMHGTQLIPEHELPTRMQQTPALASAVLNEALTDKDIQDSLTREDIPYLTQPELRETIHSAILHLWSHELAGEQGTRIAPFIAENLLDADETVLYGRLRTELAANAHSQQIALSEAFQRTTAGMELQSTLMSQILQKPPAHAELAPEHQALAEILLHGDSFDAVTVLKNFWEQPDATRQALRQRGERMQSRQTKSQGLTESVQGSLQTMVQTLQQKGFPPADIYQTLQKGVTTLGQQKKKER